MKIQPPSNAFGRRRLAGGEAKKRFVNWIKQHEPFIYRVARKRALLQQGNALAGLGVIDWGTMFSSVVNTVKDVAPSILQARQQKKIMDMQMKRAEQGLPPANVEDYTPAIKISPQITPETEQAINRVAAQSVGSGLQKLILPIGLGVGALLFLKKR